MDPVSLIVSALVSGLSAGLQATMEQAITDGYNALKSAIVSKYGNMTSLNYLEQSPNSKARQAVLEEDLRNAGADTDADIVLMAQALIGMLEMKSDTSSDRERVETSMRNVDDPIEAIQRGAGSQAIRSIVDKHITGLMDIRRKYPVNNQDLLTVNVVHNRNIPEDARMDIGRLHDRIRTIIREVATRIETRRYDSAQEVIEGMHLAYTDLQKARKLIQADKEIHISYQSLKTTVEFFADLNRVILDKLESAATRETETNLILGNALIVYELTDFVISFIEDFSVAGIGDVHRLHEETKQKVIELRRQQDDLQKRMETTSVDEVVRQQTFDDIRSREESIKLLEKEWQNYVDDVQLMQNDIGTVRNKIPTLEIIRENAKVQINLIQAVAMLQILKNNVYAMQSTILTLENMRLISLSPNRVRRLLGVS